MASSTTPSGTSATLTSPVESGASLARTPRPAAKARKLIYGRTPWTVSAGLYAAIADRLDRTVQAKDSAAGQEVILGDLGRQRDHVREALLPVSDDLREIAALLDAQTR